MFEGTVQPEAHVLLVKAHARIQKDFRRGGGWFKAPPPRSVQDPQIINSAYSETEAFIKAAFMRTIILFCPHTGTSI